MTMAASAYRRVAALLVAAIAVAPSAVIAAEPQVYAGHHVVMGLVPVPFFGETETRTDTRVLVTVREEAGVMHWVQRICGVDMAPVAGVQSSLPAATIPMLPVEDIRLRRSAEGSWHGVWDTRWSEADIDGDGHPGVSIRVDVPLCSGYVYVTSNTRTRATAHRVGDTILGEVQVSMRQRVLGASNLCLRLGPKEQQHNFDGGFILVPVSGVSACQDMSADAWPAFM